jgi:hypothetical protein
MAKVKLKFDVVSSSEHQPVAIDLDEFAKDLVKFLKTNGGHGWNLIVAKFGSGKERYSTSVDFINIECKVKS